MYPLDATKETFEVVEIVGIPGLFTTERVSVMCAFRGYGLGRRIMVEHFGTVLTASPINLPDTGYLDLKPGDFTMGTGADRLTVAGFEDRYLGRHLPARPTRTHKPKSHRVSVPAR